MEKAKMSFTITGVLILLYSYGNVTSINERWSRSISDQEGSKSTQTTPKSKQTTSKSTQTTPKSKQTSSKSTQTTPKSKQTTSKSKQPTSKSTQTGSKTKKISSTPNPVNKPKYPGTVSIGTQSWAMANLNVITFRNGDSIPEAKTNIEWETAGKAGKPAWCYYNNNPSNGPKYGKLYNWYAVNDPRGLAPAGWSLSSEADWTKLIYYLGGQGAGTKMKSTTGWIDGNNGTDESGFKGLPGGYRVENGTFLNLGSIGTWWSSTESNVLNGTEFYLVLRGSLSRSNSPKQRGASVRCLRD